MGDSAGLGFPDVPGDAVDLGHDGVDVHVGQLAIAYQ
ncbi:hypothetical protein DESC_780225 [Desulfosarcina cetonica]|nr:hypothetical protein DESC_780225 [Desulfosarcina cetonica]